MTGIEDGNQDQGGLDEDPKRKTERSFNHAFL